MYISQTTIDRVFEAIQIEEVIGDFLELKKSGANYKARSPFTEEKTPSFMVSPVKNIYKCFSSGNGGNAVSFLMDSQQMTYPEAITYLAERYNITIEHDKQSNPEASKKKQEERVSNLNVVKAAVKQYAKQLADAPSDHPAKKEIEKRQLSADDVIQWQLGYAPQGDFLNQIVKSNNLLNQAKDLFLVSDKWDILQNRFVYPLQDAQGNFIGIAGRRLDDNEKYAKFINPKDTPVYKKDRTLYGLNFASKAIRKSGESILVEGYSDVIAMHKHHCENTVASCGTALTINQISILKKHANRVTFIYDGDKAGQAAMLRALPLMLKKGLKVSLVELPEGEDPDSYSRLKKAKPIAEFIDENRKDAVLHFAKKLMAQSDDPHEKDVIIDKVFDWLSAIDQPVIHEEYVKKLISILKVSRKLATTLIKNKAPKKEEVKIKDFDLALPAGVDKNEVLKHGFYSLINKEKTGYYFRSGENQFTSYSNFVMTPLFHKLDPDDNTRIIKIDNGILPPEIVELPSKALISIDQFRNFLFDKGPFFFDGTKQHLDKLNKRYLFEFPKAFELKTLGWQPEGFFAYFNASYNGKLEAYNEVGIVKHKEQYFFSPASSDIYKGFRQEDDMYENDRYLHYADSPINFSQWSRLLLDVYDEHAYAGVGFALVSLFRDLVFKVDNNSPFLYCYGQSKSGKSKFAESISNLFFKEMPAFNLNSGTDYAFAARLARFKNCPLFFNEFDDSVVKDEWFQALKGAYDGEGRERGKGGSKKKTEIQKVNGALILAGQFLSTKDDNSVLSRSIMRVFQLTKDRGDEQTAKYNYLKQLEKEGLSGILTDLLQYRNEVESEYYKLFNENFKATVMAIRKRKKHYEERVVRNYTALLTLYKKFNKYFDLPWTDQEYTQWVISEIITMSSLISQTDVLVDFWTSLETMYTEKLIKQGMHYKIEIKQSVRLSGDEKDYNKNFSEPTPLLYVRIKNVQQLYARFKSQIKGSAIDFTSLVSYLKTRDYYIGYVGSDSFTQYNAEGNPTGSVKTSAFIFDYDLLDVYLGEAKKEDVLPF